MREKKWVDCPVCGAKKSMRAHSNLSHVFEPRGYPPIEITGLSGQFCTLCNDGFWSLKSDKEIARCLNEHLAEHDARRVYAADLASVREAAETLQVTPQAVHKMMDTGRLRYVVAGDARLPVRSAIETLRAAGCGAQRPNQGVAR